MSLESNRPPLSQAESRLRRPERRIGSRASSRAACALRHCILGLSFCVFLIDAHAQNAGSATGSAPDANEVKQKQLAAIDAKLSQGFDMFYGKAWVPHLKGERAKLAARAPFDAVWEVHTKLASWMLREGQVAEAIETLEVLATAYRTQGGSPDRGLYLIKQLAIANLRLAEQENCVCEQGGDTCIFPFQPDSQHTKRNGATRAAQLLVQGLEWNPRDLHSIWLLNLCHMALGTFPDGVPELYRIAPARLESEFDIGRFENIAPQIGLRRRACAGGAVMDDFDGDGDLDVIVTSMEPATPMAYYRNDGQGAFTDVSESTRLSMQVGGLNLVQGDIDGDGRLDLYVPRGAWMGPTGEMPHSLLQQQPDGTFMDVTVRAGIDVVAPSQVAAFGDIDNDGDLDLFVGCESIRTQSGWSYPSRLYRNLGQGRFEDIAASAGVQNNAYCKGAAFGDFDGDGLLDLFVSNLGGANRLYRNLGGGKFVDRAAELGVLEPIESFATWWFDVNNDGWLDLFVGNYSDRDRNSDIAAYYKNGTTGSDSARVFVNIDGQRFIDDSQRLRIARPYFPMGANFGDFDNDGFPDIYLGTGDPDFGSLWPNVALRNDRGRTFQDVTTSGGFGHVQKGHGVAFGDIDQDGDQDVFVNVGGAYRDDAFFDVLYRNPGHGHHWLTVRLAGQRSNRFGVGARIAVEVEEGAGSGTRTVYTWVGSGGSFGGNSLQAELGLGDATRIRSLEVKWPGTGLIERFEDVPMDRVLSITEGTGSIQGVTSAPIVFE